MNQLQSPLAKVSFLVGLYTHNKENASPSGNSDIFHDH